MTRARDAFDFRVCPTVIVSGAAINCVKAVQYLLDDDPPYAGIPADGYYGPVTSRAARGFQERHDIAPDGIAGPQTIKELKSLAPKPGQLWLTIALDLAALVFLILLIAATPSYTRAHGLRGVGFGILAAAGGGASALLGVALSESPPFSITAAATHSWMTIYGSAAVIFLVGGLTDLLNRSPRSAIP